ncbi:MAG: hypothetical protein IKB28_06600 [Clostridia bacterium]|nr:hypothetical protein [Clostridia bacterium]
MSVFAFVFHVHATFLTSLFTSFCILHSAFEDRKVFRDLRDFDGNFGQQIFEKSVQNVKLLVKIVKIGLDNLVIVYYNSE